MRVSTVTHAVLALALAGLVGCRASKPHGHPSRAVEGPERHTRPDLDLSPEQDAYLTTLATAADQNPQDFAALRASGLAHMSFALAGVLRLRDRAERDLEAAFALDPSDATLNRSLARFYNMRAVDGDDSKAQMQVEVYAALLGNGLGTGTGESEELDPLAMSDEDFVAYSFFMLGQILSAKNGGHNLRALRKVGALEELLAERVRRQPDNIEFRALAGNFAFFFAGNIPLERERRVAEAVAYFEVLRARWDELRPGARHPNHCPNTRENFMFELAEGHLVLDQASEARVIYEELAQITGPRTRAKELIAHVSAERLRNLERYRGDMRLMPPWPSDVGNCVVCHAWSAEVGLDSLYTLEPFALEDVPSQAQLQPIVGLIGMSESGEGSNARGAIAQRERLPAGVAELIEDACAPCHFGGGEAAELLDLSDAEAVEAAAADLVERVEAGDMPPEQPLSGAQVERLRAWADGLGVKSTN